MASIATITAAAETVACSAGGSAEHTFTVTNTSGAKLRVGARVIPADPAQQGWFTVEGKPERDLDDQATDQFAVRVQVPPDAPPGKRNFRLLVFSTQAPSEHFTEGPTVAIEVKAKEPVPPPPKKGFPWWILAVVLGVLVIGAVVAWLLWPRAPEVPDVVGMTLDQAADALKAEGLTVGDEVGEEITGAPAGEVIRQNPDPGTEVEKGSAVTLVIESVSIEVPDLVGKAVVDARQVLKAAGLAAGDITQERTGAPGGTVIRSDPPAGQRVLPQTTVALVVEEEAVSVPRVIGQTLAEATDTLSGRGLTVGEVTQRRAGGTPGVVLNQTPEEGQPVPPGTAVNLTVEQQSVAVPQVTNLALEEAMGRIVNEGLKVGAVTKKRQGKRPGTVLSQDPAPGTSVNPGSEVALVVEDQPPPPPKVRAQGRLTIKQTFTADLDEGKVGDGGAADIWFEADTATRRFVTPRNNAKIAKVGTRSVGRDGCAKAKLGSTRISVSTLPAGTYLCVLTNQGRYSELKVLSNVGPSPGTLRVSYITWEKSLKLVPLRRLELQRQRIGIIEGARPQ